MAYISPILRLLRIVAPVLQALVRLAVRVPLCGALLREMPLVVGHDLPHVGDVVLLILVWIFVGVLLQDFNNLAATGDIQSTFDEAWQRVWDLTSRVRQIPRTRRP